MDAQIFWEIIYFPVTLDDLYIDLQDDYLDFIFPIVTLTTLVTSGVLSAVFYNLIGNFTSRLGYKSYWFLFMVISGILGFFIAFDKIKEIIYIDEAMESDGWIFAFTNLAWAMLYFLLFSLIFKTKYFSRYSNHVPFTTKW